MVFKQKLPKAKLRYFIADEKKAQKEYHKVGLHNLEKDERKHEKYLKFKLKQAK